MGKQALAHLLKKGEFIWTPSARVAFEKLKEALSTPRLFLIFTCHLRWRLMPLTLGLGLSLCNKVIPLAFFSKALGPRRQKLSVYEKE